MIHSIIFFVRGIVVEDYIALSGVRPTEANPTPQIGSTEQGESDRVDQIKQLRDQKDQIELDKKAGDLNAQFKRLPIRTTYEIPVNIDTIKQFLTSEPRAPLHKLLKKVVASAKETIPAIQLSMRPAPSDPTYIDILPIRYSTIFSRKFWPIFKNRS